MADEGLTLNLGADGAALAVDSDGSSHKWQYCKLAFGASGTQTRVTSSTPLPVEIGDGSSQLTFGGGAEAAAILVTIANDSSGLLSIDDGGGSLTVDGTVTANAGTGTFTVDGSGVTQPISNAALSIVGGGVEAAALRVTIASDSSGLLSVNDGGGSLTIDGTVTANAGSGTFTVDGSAVTQPISHATLAVTGGGVEASALRVTLASDSTGQVSILNDDTVSGNNSTTTPLGVSGTFIGTGDDVLGYSSVVTTIFADEDSATDGMTFQFSTDDTNWDDVTAFTLTGGVTRRFQFPVTARYFRIHFTNGGVEQTQFRVQTILHRQTVKTSIHRIVDVTDPDRHGQLVKSVVIAQAAGTGNFVPVQATASGNFKVSLEEVDAAALVPVTANSSSLGDGATPVTIEHAELTVAATGDQELIAAVSGKTHKILSLMILATALTNDIYINDGTADLVANATNKIKLDVTGVAAPGGFIQQFNLGGWFKAAATNRPININLGSANAITAVASYISI